MATKPIHLYRHLLREASYLPPACQAYVAGRIRARFQRHRRDPAPQARLRRAAHDLRLLRAANGGDLGRMRRLLLHVYGRAGRRWRELMARLRRPDPPQDTAALDAAVAAAAPAAAGTDWLDGWATDRLLALARSQARQPLRDAPRAAVRPGRTDPAVLAGERNIWGRPLARSLARSRLRRWWREMAHRLLPPTSRGEWDRLAALAAGAEAGLPCPARRPPAVPVLADHEPDQGSAWPWERYAGRPVREVDRPRSRRLRALTRGHGGDGGDGGDGRDAIGIHAYTPRLWRRLYAHVWHLTPTMEKSAAATATGAAKWDITWGGQQLLRPTPASDLHREFFEGLGSPARGNRRED